MKPVQVCVTGVGGGGFGEQIAKALKLAETPYRVLGTDVSPYSAGFPLVDDTAIVPYAVSPDYIPRLLELCRQRKAAVLVPGSEAEMRAINARRGEFESEGILVLLNPGDVMDVCMDKLAMFERLQEMGFQVPWFRRVRNASQGEDFPLYPLVFKPSVGSGGSMDSMIVQNEEEAVLFSRYLLTIYDEFIAQEYVGNADQEFTVGILTDLDGVFINSIAVHRTIKAALSCRLRTPNRTGREELGETLIISSGISQGVIGPFPEVAGPCEELAERLGARGAFNVQCRFVDGHVHVFEINPRFSGTTSMRAMAGFNEPDVLIRRHLLGETIQPRFAYRTGMATRRLVEHFTEIID